MKNSQGLETNLYQKRCTGSRVPLASTLLNPIQLSNTCAVRHFKTFCQNHISRFSDQKVMKMLEIIPVSLLTHRDSQEYSDIPAPGESTFRIIVSHLPVMPTQNR